MRKAFWRRWFTGLWAAVLIVALLGCDPSNFKSQAASVSQIVSYAGSDPTTFNYALIKESPNIRDFCYRGLTGKDRNWNVVPALAESWQISEDKQRIIFTLRDGLNWSDGEPLTVDDVLFSYNEVYLNQRIPNNYVDGLRIGQSGAFPTVRKLDDRRVEFASPEPFAPLLRATDWGILPAHVLRQSVIENDEKGNPRFLTTWGIDTVPTKIIVNGPYKIESYLTSQRLVFRRNPYYWEKDEQGNPLPYVERVIIQIVKSSDTALLQFRSNGLDLLVVNPQTFSLLKREEKRGDFTIYDAGPNASTSFILFNLNKGRRKNRPIVDPIKSRWFNTVAFRQAVAYALDRDKMNNNTFRGLGVLQNSPISVQSPYYFSPEEGLKVYDHNLEKAKQLLQGAGFKYNAANQLLDADGNAVQFTMISQTGNKRVEAMGTQVKQDLSKVGIQVDYQPIDFGTIGDKLSNTYDWECLLGAIDGSIEPNDGFNIWSPDGNFHLFNQKPQPGQPSIEGREVADWEERIGRLYIQGTGELDEAKRKAIYGETQQLSQEYLPFIHLVNATIMAAVRNRVQGVELSSLFYESVLWKSARLKVVEED